MTNASNKLEAYASIKRMFLKLPTGTLQKTIIELKYETELPGLFLNTALEVLETRLNEVDFTEFCEAIGSKIRNNYGVATMNQHTYTKEDIEEILDSIESDWMREKFLDAVKSGKYDIAFYIRLLPRERMSLMRVTEIGNRFDIDRFIDFVKANSRILGVIQRADMSAEAWDLYLDMIVRADAYGCVSTKYLMINWELYCEINDAYLIGEDCCEEQEDGSYKVVEIWLAIN